MTSLQMFAMTSHMLTIQSDIVVPMSSIPCRVQMAHVNIKAIRVETIQWLTNETYTGSAS